MKSSRRQFLQQSTNLAAGAMLPAETLAATATGSTFSAADTLSVALIGCNSMGWADLSSMLKHPGVRCGPERVDPSGRRFGENSDSGFQQYQSRFV
jgi:hypothetical protein